MTTTIKTALPELDLEAEATLTVDAGDASAVITAVRVHVSQDAPVAPLKIPALPPLVTYGPQGGQEAPGLTR